MKNNPKSFAFQGFIGAYSHAAGLKVFSKAEAIPCLTFEEVFEKVRSGKADVGVIPIDNSIAGRVADIHHLLPKSNVAIIGEHFEEIRHCLLGVKGAKLSDITIVESHIHALNQCRKFIHSRKLKAVVNADTAGAALDISKRKQKNVGAIASELAGKEYGLSVLARNIEDSEHNTTRFIIIAKNGSRQPSGKKTITSLIFRVRSVPAALYKAIGGFATNGINIAKIESYIVDQKFTVAEFYVEVEGSPEEKSMQHALEELNFYSKDVTILGVYPAHPFRYKK